MTKSIADHPPRLAVVDGWRAVAVMGVVWWHAWIHTGNPPLYVWSAHPVNLQRLLVLFGNGVHLFFVLSGFCICLALKKATRPGGGSYLGFIANRWWRLTPAFYVVTVFTAVALIVHGEPVTWTQLAAHFTWLYSVWPGVNSLAAPFWSIPVEWEFYLIAPLLLVRPHRQKFVGLAVLMIASLICRYHALTEVHVIPPIGDEHLITHFTSFAWGIMVAEGWINRSRWFQRIAGWLPMLAGFALAYLGRAAVMQEVVQAFGPVAAFVKTAGHPIMTLGFAIMLAATLNGVRGAGEFLSQPVMQWLGRHSYSLYLWHWWPCVWVGHALRDQLGVTIVSHYLTLAATLAICLPLTWATYRFCEAPYFRQRHGQVAQPSVARSG